MELAKWHRVYKHDGKTKKSETALDVLEVYDANVFPTIYTLIYILVTLPVSIATAERFFSTLHLLNIGSVLVNYIFLNKQTR